MSFSPRFAEVVATARGAGFDLVDAGGLPVGPQQQGYLEDENLMAEPATVVFREPPAGVERGVVADIAVAQQQFALEGEWRRVGELQHLLRGAKAPEERRPDTP